MDKNAVKIILTDRNKINISHVLVRFPCTKCDNPRRSLFTSRYDSNYYKPNKQKKKEIADKFLFFSTVFKVMKVEDITQHIPKVAKFGKLKSVIKTFLSAVRSVEAASLNAAGRYGGSKGGSPGASPVKY